MQTTHIIITMAALFGLACGPGEPQVSAEVRASEACHGFCEVRSTCDPDATDPDAAGCFDTCMELSWITDESTCGLARRELQACIGELSCEGYDLTMTPNAVDDPCIDAKLRLAELKCGAEESP